MAERSFLDANVLVYVDDRRDPAKQARAADLVKALRADGAAVVSTQVLQEYYAVATRKLGLDAEAARRRLELLTELPVVQVTPALILAGADLSRLHRLNFWDALIVEAARAGGCAILYSEDMQAGRRFGALEVVNPFV